MILMIGAVAGVVVFNLALLVVAKRVCVPLKQKWQVWILGGTEFARLAVFFLAGHMIWLVHRQGWSVVAFIFMTATIQMTLQIFLHFKGRL